MLSSPGGWALQCQHVCVCVCNLPFEKGGEMDYIEWEMQVIRLDKLYSAAFELNFSVFLCSNVAEYLGLWY